MHSRCLTHCGDREMPNGKSLLVARGKTLIAVLRRMCHCKGGFAARGNLMYRKLSLRGCVSGRGNLMSRHLSLRDHASGRGNLLYDFASDCRVGLAHSLQWYANPLTLQDLRRQAAVL